MPLPPIKIAATGTYIMGVGSFDEAYVNGVSLTISGLTGSVTVQKQQALGNITGFTPTPYNCSYVNANTDTYGTAGTAITADGQYLVSATAAVVLLNVTAVTGSFTVVVTAVEGAVGGTSSGGGGGGGSLSAVATAAAPTYTEGSSDALSMTLGGALRVSAPATTVPLLTQGTDQTGAFFMPPMDAVGREGYQIISGGAVATAASAAGLKPIIVGGVDASGNVAQQTYSLLNAAPAVSTVAAPVTFSAVAGRNSTSGMSVVGVMSLIADGASGPAALATGSVRFNSSTWDREYNNASVTVFASASRTATNTSADLINYNGRALHVILDVTVPGTGSITVSINGKDTPSAKYYPILAGVAVTTAVTNVYKIGLGLPVTANVSVNDFLPRIFQIVVTANNANAITYSVGYNLLS